MTTEDGYILEMHRIPHGRDTHNTPGEKPVIFLMHGLLSSSADWVLMGPGSGLGTIFSSNVKLLAIYKIHEHTILTRK